MALSGDAIDARTALDWGLVNRVVPAGSSTRRVDDLLERVTRGSAESKGIGKQALYAQIDLDQPKAYAYAIEVMAATSQLPTPARACARSWRSASRNGAAAGRPPRAVSGGPGAARRRSPGTSQAACCRARQRPAKRISQAGGARRRRSFTEGAPLPAVPARPAPPGARPGAAAAAPPRWSRRWPAWPSSVPVPGTWSVRAADPAPPATADSAARPGGPPGRPPRPRGPARRRVPGLLPWHLAQPLSREIVVPGARGRLVVLGGLTASGGSLGGVYAIRTRTGAARPLGSLRAPLHHDAAVSVSGGRALVFGGGPSSAIVPSCQSFPDFFPGRGGAARAAMPAAGPLRCGRGVAIGATSYVIGGYDGTQAGRVRARRKGRPRVPAGGLAASAGALPGGRGAGRADLRVRWPGGNRPPPPARRVDGIQLVSPARHSATVIAAPCPSGWRARPRWPCAARCSWRAG